MTIVSVRKGGRCGRVLHNKRDSRGPRIEFGNVAPDGIKTMSAFENYVQRSGLEPALLDLVKIRASQINGCAYCIDVHSKDAWACGETEQRLYARTAWFDTPFFTDRERAALAWTEALTEVAHAHVPDEAYELARQHFGEKELVDLTLATNCWNRLAISFQKVPGTYHPSHH